MPSWSIYVLIDCGSACKIGPILLQECQRNIVGHVIINHALLLNSQMHINWMVEFNWINEIWIIVLNNDLPVYYLLLSVIPYRTKLRRTKLSADKIFRRTKFLAPSRNFGTLVRQNFVIGFLFSHTIHKKNMRFVLFWHVWDFCGQNISVDKIFSGQNFSAEIFFGSKSNFRQFCPSKFCPIKGSIYYLIPNTSESHTKYPLPDKDIQPKCSRQATLLAAT